jgi:hypothetical protein
MSPGIMSVPALQISFKERSNVPRAVAAQLEMWTKLFMIHEILEDADR